MNVKELAQKLFFSGFKSGASEELASKADVDGDGTIDAKEEQVVDEALKSFKTAWQASPRVKLANWVAQRVSTGSNETLSYRPNAIGQALRAMLPDDSKMMHKALDAELEKKRRQAIQGF